MKRREQGTSKQSEPKLRGFDDFSISLGDQMRGERATLGLSLLDIQRELRIKADYLAAIEECNPDGFDGPGFISGYVRSYSRYLGLDPDEAYAKFCLESGFAGVHGAMSSRPAETRKAENIPRVATDPVLGRGMPQNRRVIPWYGQVDPGALGSGAVLLALIAGLSYGAMSVVKEFQRVTVVPVESNPALLAELDPLAPVPVSNDPVALAEMTAPSVDALDRLYRPQALDVPVMVPRDGPIANINPDAVGLMAGVTPDALPAGQPGEPVPGVVQVVEDAAPALELIAVAAAWVRVRSADGSVLLEKIMEPGERYTLPATEEPPVLRAGAAGAVFFAVGGEIYGPAGSSGSVASNVVLSAEALRESYTVADLTAQPGLAAIVNVAQAGQ